MKNNSNFQEIFLKSPIGIILYDKDGKLIDINESALDITGIAKVKDILRTNLFDIPFIESKKEELLEKEIIKFQTQLNFENIKKAGYYDPTKSGTIYIDWIISVTNSGFLMQIQDITERKQAEYASKESEGQLRMINEIASIVTYEFDPKTGQIHWLPDNTILLGVNSGSIRNKEDSMAFLHPEEFDKISAIFEYSMDPAGDGIINVEYRALRTNGEVRWLKWIGRTYFQDTAKGRIPLRQLGVLMDINEYKQIEKELIEARDNLELKVQERTAELDILIEELKHSNDELQRFAYITSHDLQEPLRTIASFTQLLERRYKGKLDSDADEFMDYIVEAATRMKQMINDLLEYSRIGTQRKEFQLVDMEEVLNNALSNLRDLIERNHAEITHDPLPTVIADRSQLLQLLQNLTNNAIKFRKPDENPKIHISTKKDIEKNEYVFSVADNGIGIEKQYFDRIFTIFQRLHTREEYDGTGIGLSIVKRIVERHGGHIWVESELINGSTFYFAIPINGEI